jgi:hypothetical protein
VTYTPGTQAFNGYAWNDNLGYLDFSDGIVGATFKNKIKIIGAVGANKVYDSEYNLGTRLGTSGGNTAFINNVRKNISLLTRNVPSSIVNTSNTDTKILSSNIAYYRGDFKVTSGTRMNANNLRSIIVEGGDIYIDSTVPPDSDVQSPRTFIAIKDANGKGGNIFIGKSVKNIYASLVAEGSIFSGEGRPDANASNKYNDTLAEVNALPAIQLFINGTVISRNTIG